MITSLSFRGARATACCLALLAVALPLAACGASSSAPVTNAASTTASGATRVQDRGKLAACLRRHGVTLPSRPPGGSPPNGTTTFGAPPSGATTFSAPPSGTIPNGAPPPGRRFFGGRRLSAAQRRKLQQAFTACGARFGAGGRFGVRPRFDARNPAVRKALQQYVACVRTHGFALPDANTSGRGPVFDPRKTDPRDPKFVAASRACQALLRGIGPASAPLGPG